ncbi:MAG TPA: hypothetical protein VMU50_08400 [Polyangia bacterium]|nr:hypothetical protein [Polyangia bacterium]
MTTRSIGFLIVLGLAGNLTACATSPTFTGRGTVVASSAGARAIVAGPVDVHAYAGFRGGEVYLVDGSSGSDGDCAAAADGTAALPVPSDTVVSLTVPAGRTACLRTRAAKGYELLWHARAHTEPSALLATASSPTVK